jgi:hypothetical protein
MCLFALSPPSVLWLVSLVLSGAPREPQEVFLDSPSVCANACRDQPPSSKEDAATGAMKPPIARVEITARAAKRSNAELSAYANISLEGRASWSQVENRPDKLLILLWAEGPPGRVGLANSDWADIRDPATKKLSGAIPWSALVRANYVGARRYYIEVVPFARGKACTDANGKPIACIENVSVVERVQDQQKTGGVDRLGQGTTGGDLKRGLPGGDPAGTAESNDQEHRVVRISKLTARCESAFDHKPRSIYEGSAIPISVDFEWEGEPPPDILLQLWPGVSLPPSTTGAVVGCANSAFADDVRTTQVKDAAKKPLAEGAGTAQVKITANYVTSDNLVQVMPLAPNGGFYYTDASKKTIVSCWFPVVIRPK